MRWLFLLLICLAVLPAISVAADEKDEAIKKDRKMIAGTWRITRLIVDGNPAQSDDIKNIFVENGDDGSWIVRANGQEVGRGTSEFDPTAKPKTIDLTPTEGGGKGERYLGIYELKDNTRKLCFAPPGEDRPAEFESPSGSQQILVELERKVEK